MPTYEYACRECGEHLEVVQSFRDDPLTECPACTGQLRKVFSAAGIIFKGSGWHVKDYAAASKGGGDPESGGDGRGESAESTAAKTDGGSSDGSGGKSSSGGETSTSSSEGATTSSDSGKTSSEGAKTSSTQQRKSA